MSHLVLTADPIMCVVSLRGPGELMTPSVGIEAPAWDPLQTAGV